MKSVNIGKIGAVVTGAAMIGTVLATGFSAVQTVGNVPSLVSAIKENIKDTQVVVGSNAQLADGIQAARVAAVLASLNYKQTEITPSGEAKVTLKVAGTSQFEISGSAFTKELTANTSKSSYETNGTSFTITPQVMPDVFTETPLTLVINGAQQTFRIQEKLDVNLDKVKYDEAGPTPSGHGLYLAKTGDAINYTIDFTAGGQGLPTNSSVYSEIPEITMLGYKYALDTKELANNKVVLYSGTKDTYKEGETYNIGDAKLTIVAIGATSTQQGTKYTVTVRVERGTQSYVQSLDEGSSYDFFSGNATLSVFVEKIIYGSAQGSMAVLRVGSGKIEIKQGDKFPFDPTWRVTQVNFSNTGDALNKIVLSYGDPSSTDPVIRGNFDGTVTNGLAQNVKIYGPKSGSGSPTFYIELLGLGNSDPVYTTPIEVTGIGTAPNSLIQVKWTDKDGLTNVFDPTTNTSYKLANSTDANVTLDATARYTIVNDKVLYFSGIESPSTDMYSPVFKLGGVNGLELKGTAVANGQDSTVTYYGASGSQLSCAVTVNNTNYKVTIKNGTNCDIYPDSVEIGQSIYFPTSIKANMTGLGGGVNVGESNESNKYVTRPVIQITDAASKNILIVYDDTTTSGGYDTGTYQGMQVYYNVPYTNISNFWFYNISNISSYIDQARPEVYEQNKYHISPTGVVLDGSTTNKVIATVPSKTYNALVRIASTTTGAAGETVLKEGEKKGNIEIVKIEYPTTVSGTYYEQKAAITPESLIVLDSQATKPYQIVIGGYFVNSIAQKYEETQAIKAQGDQYLIATSDNKLIAAGWSAEDTAAAVDELIGLLKG
ncbi:MAG: S-layer protein [archaeon]